MRIGCVELNGNMTLAPLAGYSDVGLRYLAVRYGAALTVTEMVSAKGLVYKGEKSKELLATAPNEKVKCVQLFGADPEFIAKAVALDCLKKFDIIDINMGCPVPKIVKNGEGSALLENIPNAKRVVEAAISASDGRPVTVKMRLGVFDTSGAENFACEMARSGAAALTVHGRTREQKYGGVADHEAIARVVKAVDIPVIANGDVIDKNSFDKAMSTGAAGVAIGRGAVGNPYIFSQLKGESIRFDLYDDIMTHIDMLRSVYDDRRVALNMKKHICAYGKMLKHSKCLKNDVFAAETLDDILKIVEFYFKGVSVEGR